MIGDKTGGWVIRCGALLAYSSMAWAGSPGMTEPMGSNPEQLCARSFLLHTSNTDPRWRSTAQCPRFLGTTGFPLSTSSKRT
jgi:hypothetical protein